MAKDLERFRKTGSRSFETGDSVSLRVENNNGSVVVQGGKDSRVVVSFVAELWAESAADVEAELGRIERGMSQNSDSIAIHTPELMRPAGSSLGWALSRAAKVEYQISVPFNTAVSVAAKNAKMAVSSVSGPVEVEGQSGSVDLTRVEEAVRVGSRSGSVKVRRAGAAVAVTSKNGAISVEEARGPVVCEANNGSIEIINAGSSVRAQTRNGSVRYRGRVLGPVQVETRNGSIRVGVPADSRFELDATSTRGSVGSDLEVRSGTSSGSTRQRHLVRLRSDNGGVRLEQDSLAGLPDLPSEDDPGAKSTA